MKKNKNSTILLVLGMMVFLANGDNYAAASMISNIAGDLNVTVSTAALSVTAYMLSFGLFTLLFGPLADRFGKVKIINIAAVGTAVFSMLGATAYNLPSLITFRAINGMFGAGIFPVALAYIGEIFDDKHKQKALGKVMGLGFLGTATATAIGGLVAYFGSWRYVYLIYGIAELIFAIIMLRVLERDQPVVKKFQLFTAYKEGLTNSKFMRVVVMLFFVGFAVLGSFTYSGIFIQNKTGYNILIVGIMLSVFGLGTVVGGKLAARIRAKLKHAFLIVTGVFGFLSLLTFASFTNIVLILIGFFGYGIAFIFLQSTLIATAQGNLPKRKGTAMSMVSFNMFVGAAVGTTVNGIVMKTYDLSTVFTYSGIIILMVGIVAGVIINGLDRKKVVALKEALGNE